MVDITTQQSKLPLTTQEVIDEITTSSQCYDKLSNNHKTGTMSDVYVTMMMDTVESFMLMQARRMIEGLDQLTEEDDITSAVFETAQVISRACGIPLHIVQQDMSKVVDCFPSADIQTSTVLRIDNRLN